MKTFNFILERKMFAVILFIIASVVVLEKIDENFGVSKTVGWAYDWIFFNFVICFLSCVLFFIIYSIIALLKFKTNKTISLAHLILIIIVAYLYKILDVRISLFLNLLSIILFLVNIGWSIIKRKQIS